MNVVQGWVAAAELAHLHTQDNTVYNNAMWSYSVYDSSHDVTMCSHHTYIMSEQHCQQ